MTGSPRSLKLRGSMAFFVLAPLGALAQSYLSVPRWGQASAVIYDILFIHGGKTDPSHQYTYNSAPNSNDLLILDLSSSFSLSTPPWSYVSGSQNTSTSQGPAVAFHTLTPYTTSQLLLFGGDAGFTPIGTNADSAWLLNASNYHTPTWISKGTGWASEPIRRVQHAAPSASGAIYILGGQKGDDSQLGFSDSYVFNAVDSDGSPAFVPLSDSSNGPAHLYGHAAHVLPNGMLIVLGGFFSSSNSPSLLSVIYTLDTRSSSLSWSPQNVSGIAPSPRRNFASALLENGKILIHGGADATLQNMYSDGALLDTTQDPMSWSPVSGLSDALGARVGHFAVPNGGRVLFGFGWAGNAPASADLILYDPSSNSVASSYTPPTSPASITTLPVSPTAPGGAYSSAGASTGESIRSNPTSAPGSNPTSGNGPGKSEDGNRTHSSGDSSPKPHVVGAALGTLFGVLSFVAFAGGTAYYMLRRWRHFDQTGLDANNRKDAKGQWQLIRDDQAWDAGDEDLTHTGGKLQMAGTGWAQAGRGWAALGLGALVGAAAGKRAKTRQRLDMLADEDGQEFDVLRASNEHWDTRDVSTGGRREGTGGSSQSFSAVGTAKSAWSEMVNTSVASLRNVSAALGMGAAGAAVATQGGGKRVDSPYWWEKDDPSLNPFSDDVAIEKVEPAAQGSEAMIRPRSVRYLSRPKASDHTPPFSCGGEHNRGGNEVTYSLLDNVHEEGTTNTLGDDGVTASSQASRPRSIGSVSLAPTTATPPDASTSVDSHDAPSTHTANSHTVSQAGSVPATSSSSDLSSNQYNSSTNSRPRTTSIIGVTSAPNLPMRRSDSWWLRFSRTSFRDRHMPQDPATARTPGDALIDFRDPNPAPRLGPIEENVQQNESSPQIPQNTVQDKKLRRKSGSGYAVSTHSSIKTENTADSELIEHFGGRMEVVQRALSLHSRRTGSPSNSVDSAASPEAVGTWGPSMIEASSSSTSNRKSWVESNADAAPLTVDSPSDLSPQTAEFPGNPAVGVATSTPITPTSHRESDVPTSPGPRSPRRVLTGAVAARVSAYERISMEGAPQQNSRSPSADNKARQEERKFHNGVRYGLVPKASLFVANPDR